MKKSRTGTRHKIWSTQKRNADSDKLTQIDLSRTE
jgi:hypothetical protein